MRNRHMDKHISACGIFSSDRCRHRKYRIGKHVVIGTGQITTVPGHSRIKVRNDLIFFCLLIGIGDDLTIPVHEPDVDMENLGDGFHLLIDDFLREGSILIIRICGGNQRGFGVQVLCLLPDQIIIGETGGKSCNYGKCQCTKQDIGKQKFKKQRFFHKSLV